MKLLSLLLVFFVWMDACTNRKKESAQNKQAIQEVVFQSILDSAQVKGSILIHDPKSNHYYSNDFSWANSGYLPASTFKIVNSIIALETGVIESDSTLIKWDRKKKRFKAWEEDLQFIEAFRRSCLPCYQDIARRIGVQRMTKYIDKLDYREMKVDSSNLDIFWLIGDSKISQFQQIAFLKRLYNSKLPISKRTEDLVKDMMALEANEDYKIYGKTGWSISNGVNNGWFVGYIENTDGVLFFASNIRPKEGFDMKKFNKIRIDITKKAFGKLKI